MKDPRDSAELVTACNLWVKGDIPAFAQITAAALRILGLYQRDLADEFDVSIATVSRWASGEAKPHPIVQETVVDFVRRRAVKVAAAMPRRAPRPTSHPDR